MPQTTNSEKRTAALLLTLAAFLQASQTGAAPREGKPFFSSPSVRQVLGWLPANTETIAVAKGPFKVEVRAGSEANTDKTSLKEILEEESLGPLYFCDGACAKELRAQKVLLAVEGSRNFRAPNGLGRSLYDGCHVLVFQHPLGTASTALRQTLRIHAKKIFRSHNNLVFAIEEKWKKDVWTIYIVQPQNNVLLCATDQHYLEEVLKRQEDHAKIKAAPTRLSGWKSMVRNERFWALHCDREIEDYALGKDRIFTFTPGHRDIARIYYFSKDKAAQKTIRRSWTGWHDGVHLTPKTLKVRPGVIQATFRVKKDSEAPLAFLFGLLAHLGHCICC